MGAEELKVSVDVFRRQAAHIFYVWVGQWWKHTGDPRISPDRVRMIAALVQVHYWDLWKRGPTVHEWVDEVVRYAGAKKTVEQMRAEMATRVTTPDVELNKLKPFWAILQMANGAVDRALRSYSEEVGRVFLGRPPLNKDSIEITRLFHGLDLTKPEHINSVFVMMGYRRPWWKRVFRRKG